MRGPDGDVGLVHLPSHPRPFPGAALSVHVDLEVEVEVLLGVLLLEESAEQSGAICKG